jgi:hypothetical protein
VALVSLGLLHGSQPDVIVVCHDIDRKEMLGHPGYVLPDVWVETAPFVWRDQLLAGMGLWGLTIIRMLNSYNNLSNKYNGNIRFAEMFGIAAFLLGSAFIVWNLWTVWKGTRRWPAKVWSIVLALSAFIVLWLAFVFNLFSFGIHF